MYVCKDGGQMSESNSCDYFTKRTALLGPKDLPIIARTVGRLAGRAIGYVQLARGQFDNIMQQNQARQVFLYPPTPQGIGKLGTNS